MLTTPVLNTIETFDARFDKQIRFVSVGGNQVYGSNLVITPVGGSVPKYDQTQISFNLVHTIPSGSLTNGVHYEARIRTRDSQLIPEWSSLSAPVRFWCFEPPTLRIENINYSDQNRVYNETIIFSTSYTQANSEAMQSYRYLLYNENKELIYSYPEHFGNGSEPLTQTISGLENGTLYYLEVKTISAVGNKGTTGLVWFKPFYVAPKLVVAIEVDPLPEMGAIKISANIIQIILKLFDNNGNQIPPNLVEFIEEGAIDMRRPDYQRLVAEDGFKITQDDFILQLWCRDLPEDENFLTLFSDFGKIEMFKYEKRIRIYKSINGLDMKSYYASDEFEATALDDLMIYVKQKDNSIDIKVEVL